MKSRLSLISALLVTVLSVSARAQGAPSRTAGTVGVLAFEGTRGEAGVGLSAAGRFTITRSGPRRLAFEVGVQMLKAFAQTCTQSIPGACNPESPVSPVWHGRVLGSTGFRPIYLTAGLGAYGPIGPADQPETLALGLDFGVGIHLSSRAALEVGFLHVRSTRVVGWAVPISLVVGL